MDTKELLTEFGELFIALRNFLGNIPPVEDRRQASIAQKFYRFAELLQKMGEPGTPIEIEIAPEPKLDFDVIDIGNHAVKIEINGTIYIKPIISTIPVKPKPEPLTASEIAPFIGDYVTKTGYHCYKIHSVGEDFVNLEQTTGVLRVSFLELADYFDIICGQYLRKGFPTKF